MFSCGLHGAVTEQFPKFDRFPYIEISSLWDTSLYKLNNFPKNEIYLSQLFLKTIDIK